MCILVDMKNLFEFIDYRQFLLYYYKMKKAESRHFSFRFFAQKAGINSSSFLKHIIDGRRNLTPVACEKFCKALGLNEKETIYFRHLVLFNQSETAAEKQEHYAVLRSLTGNVRETVLKAAQYDYFAKWYMPVVRELVCAKDFKDDFSALGRSILPPIGAVQARQAVRLLEKLGMIRRCKNGRFEQTTAAVSADDSVTTLSQKEYVAAMMRHAGDAVHAFDKKQRHTSTVTIGISKLTYEVLAAEIEAFKDRMKRIVSQDSSFSRVYQFNVALFPVSIESEPAEQEGLQ
jgi:uncharacterized protein (TIGR02147 family)